MNATPTTAPAIPDARTPEEISAFDQAWQTYRAGGVRDFAADVIDHHRTGFVFSMPRMFVMARAVLLEDGRAAWEVNHAVGELTALLSVVPFPLDWIVFRRRRDLRDRVYSLPRLIALANRQSKNESGKQESRKEGDAKCQMPSALNNENSEGSSTVSPISERAATSDPLSARQASSESDFLPSSFPDSKTKILP